MPEIRINAKPCPKCGHRNVTGEERICERCGTSLSLDRRIRMMVLGAMILVFMVTGGVFAINALGDSDKGLAAPAPENSPVSATTPEPKTPVKTPSTTLVADNPGKSAATASPAGAPSAAAYQELVTGAEMLVNDLPLRVRSGPLENFESPDFDALADLLSQDAYADREILIVGLAEAVGTAFMALNRAEFAKTVLAEKYHLTNPIQAIGLGPEESGSPKEPRIEIWVK